MQFEIKIVALNSGPGLEYWEVFFPLFLMINLLYIREIKVK
jgi:hypothetical protein